ncbi:molybdenum-dependent transcriptional regulator [Cronobacter dublinensis]|uniref:molybdenum-dependent transcriptional regulator n=1 Tax=Cronobacter dublinensis TaxID=413497 RepID=UPI000CFB20C2|nr:molybdenum-dependent transcriptional regulator [Cronobacter dublinensis]ELQ6132947.1 molybdenum-dependent transcriptional regulator [Cronobacter dublinensis]MDT3605044.1 molybdenum-dependent transcriptional regulator [Cronobacter dublinensis]
MQADILLTLKLHDKTFADPRRIALLKQVAQTGSISQGAKLAGISYKSAWDAINEMNQLGDGLLVERATGGKGGGGAQVTPYGARLIALYDLLGQIQQKAFDALSDDALPLDSLLAAIARFSLQTSARNQWFGQVVARDADPVQEMIEIALAGSNTRIRAAVTSQSAERLALAPGKEVLALVKAPWVQLAREPQAAANADNQFAGTISHISRTAQHCEVLLTLPDGQMLCATLTPEAAQALDPQEGLAVTAWFTADSVIVATLC